MQIKQIGAFIGTDIHIRICIQFFGLEIEYIVATGKLPGGTKTRSPLAHLEPGDGLLGALEKGLLPRDRTKLGDRGVHELDIQLR